MRSLLLVAVFVSCLPSVALGAMFSAPIPDFIGPLFPPSTLWEGSFDFHQEFAEIENVWVEIGAEIFAQEFDACGTLSDPQPCFHSFRMPGLIAFLDEEDKSFAGSIVTRELSYSDNREAPFASGVAIEPLINPSFNPYGWEVLLDGQGSVRLAYNALNLPWDLNFMNVISPSGEISSARVIIEGTPIPEPSTAVFVGIGLMLLRCTRDKRAF